MPKFVPNNVMGCPPVNGLVKHWHFWTPVPVHGTDVVLATMFVMKLLSEASMDTIPLLQVQVPPLAAHGAPEYNHSFV